MSVESLLFNPSVALVSSMESEISHVKWEDDDLCQLRDGLQYQSLQAQIFLPAALKMRKTLVMWQVNSHNPACGYCPLNPEGV